MKAEKNDGTDCVRETIDLVVDRIASLQVVLRGLQELQGPVSGKQEAPLSEWAPGDVNVPPPGFKLVKPAVAKRRVTMIRKKSSPGEKPSVRNAVRMVAGELKVFTMEKLREELEARWPGWDPSAPVCTVCSQLLANGELKSSGAGRGRVYRVGQLKSQGAEAKSTMDGRQAGSRVPPSRPGAPPTQREEILKFIESQDGEFTLLQVRDHLDGIRPGFSGEGYPGAILNELREKLGGIELVKPPGPGSPAVYRRVKE